MYIKYRNNDPLNYAIFIMYKTYVTASQTVEISWG
jgi:hypothetical protein